MKKKNLGMILAIMFMVSSFPAFTVLGNTETVTVGPLTGSISVGSNETKTLAGTFVSVSYTHLDVYKRQFIDCVQAGRCH